MESSKNKNILLQPGAGRVVVYFPLIGSEGANLASLECMPLAQAPGRRFLLSHPKFSREVEQILADVRFHESPEHSESGVRIRFAPSSFTGTSYGLALALADKLARLALTCSLAEQQLYASGHIFTDGHGTVTTVRDFTAKVALIGEIAERGSIFIYPQANYDQADQSLRECLARLSADQGIDCYGIAHVDELDALFNVASTPVLPSPVATTSAPAVTGERRQLTVIYCDLVNPAALANQLDPEDLQELIRHYRHSCTQVIDRYQGYIAKTPGTALMAYFGYPQAHENDAGRALHAGLELIEAVAAIQTHSNLHLQTRIGVATGLVVTASASQNDSSQVGEVFGAAPNLAIQLQSLADPDTLLISSSTQALAGLEFKYREMVSLEIEGFAEPVEVWQVSGTRMLESRFDAAHSAAELTPMIGRGAELSLLLDRWQQAQAGEGQVVLLSGDPGIGKSRIVQALRDQIAGESHFRLSYQCSPYRTNSSLYPVIQQLSQAAGFADGDTNEHKLEKLEQLLGQAVADVAEAASLIADLLSISGDGRYVPLDLTPEQRKQKTFKILSDQLLGLAVQKPVLFILEDVHWIDPTTRELVESNMLKIQDAPVLILLSSRSDFVPSASSHDHVTSLALNRLSRQQAAALVDNIAGGKTLPPEVLEQIISKTDGIPLFIEEFTKTIFESGLLQEQEDRYVSLHPLPQQTIPDTLQDSLTARLDQLASIKPVAQIGAVIGREFTHTLLAEVAALDEAQLDQALDQLMSARLIFRHGIPPEASYTFKHAMIQDTAYESLLKSRRQQLHGQIATTLEQKFSAQITNEPELLAQHFSQAGLSDRAVPYWIQAGQKALNRMGLMEAVSHLTTALAANEQQPEGIERDRLELQIRLLLASAYFALLGWAAIEVPRTLKPARDLARLLGEQEKLTSNLYYLWFHHGMRCEYPMADEATTELYSVAQSTTDAKVLITARMTDASARCWRGDFAGSSRVGTEVAASYAPDVHGELVQSYNHDPKCLTQIWASAAMWSLGYPDQALQFALEQLSLARRIGHIWNLAWGLTGGSISLLFRGDTQLMLEWNAEALAIGRERAMGVVEQMIYPFWSGFAAITEGEYEKGYALLLPGAEGWQASGGVHMIPQVKVVLAQACLGTDKTELAQSLVSEAIELIDRTGHRMYEAEAHRVLGEILLNDLHRDVTAAEGAFLKALDIARSQQAKSWELRTATSLARLWRDQKKRQESYDLLAPVYNWFTEGFNTTDLKDAKTLLEDLA